MKPTRAFVPFLFLAAACVVCFSACGGVEAGAEGTRASPVDAYRIEDATESPEGCRPRRAAQGCARLFTAGSAVGGAFTFENLFVECAHDDAGFTVRMRNLPDTHATFRLEASLVGVPNPKGLFACQGAEDGGGGTGDIARGSCLVAVRVHGDLFSASKAGFCYLEMRAGSPSSGRLACDGLTYGEKTFTIGDRSTFRCQAAAR